MNSRELRRQRRAAERKATKLEKKQNAAAAAPAIGVTPVVLADLSHHDDDFGEPASAPAVTTPDHTARNRENAQASTGPRTTAGREASSRNSLKHGLACGKVVIDGEDEAGYQELLASLLEEHVPATATESLLIKEMATSHWLAARALRLQNSCFQGADVDAKSLALFLRYQSTHQRNFYKALTELRRAQKGRPREQPESQIGFVSQNRETSVKEIGFVSQNLPAASQSLEEKVKEWLLDSRLAA